MAEKTFLDNLDRLHYEELCFRKEALEIIQNNLSLRLHLDVAERTMSLAKMIYSSPVEDEDYKVIRMLSARLFNAFGASINLLLSGYHQKGAMIMRDIMETMFLIDLFRTDHTAIKRWRCANDNKGKKEFLPVKVREVLDARDGAEVSRRYEAYKMLSELATHATMGTQYMIRDNIDSDMLIGPFMGETILRQGLEQLGILAIETDTILETFLHDEYEVEGFRESSALHKDRWLEFFSKQTFKFLHLSGKAI